MSHVMVIGSGGREHALAWKLAQSPHVTRVSVAPGNGGTATFADNVDIDATDIVSLLEFAETERVDLAVVGPEEPLAMGIVDQFEAAKVRIFGPSRQAALIETSKRFAKQLMTARNVPTGPYEVFNHVDEALNYIAEHAIENIVIKADGLARGKGVFLPRGSSDAEGILRALLEREALGRAGRYVIIEERLVGEELSVMAFSDGTTVAAMPAVCDYKRLHDGDTGPNTGGMGSFAPSPAMTPELSDEICERILKPVLDGLQDLRCCFKGVLNVGVVLTRRGPMALELNVRLGDPSAQTVLPLLENDLYEVIQACINGTLGQMEIRWRNEAAVTVMLTSGTYPERDDPGLPIISGALPPDVLLFHSGTRYTDDDTLVTTRGRVMGVTSLAPTLPLAVASAYDAARRIHFDDMHYRTDIGPRTR